MVIECQRPLKRWTCFDVTKALFALIRDDLNVSEISARTPDLHDALFLLSKEFPDFLGGYSFDERGDFAYSREFQTHLTALEMAGHLSCPNPDFVGYQIRDKAVRNFTNYTAGLFSSDECDRLRTIAKRMVELAKPRPIAV